MTYGRNKRPSPRPVMFETWGVKFLAEESCRYTPYKLIIFINQLGRIPHNIFVYRSWISPSIFFQSGTYDVKSMRKIKSMKSHVREGKNKQ